MYLIYKLSTVAVYEENSNKYAWIILITLH